jgi:general stress protein 26
MGTNTNLQFISEKINQLRNAIMYVDGSGPVKLENDIVTAIRVDDEGQLWFLTNYPSQHVEECEQNFPARLLFYKKGVNFFMRVSGKATIINDSCSDNHADSDNNDRSQKLKKVLMKLTMINIEYTASPAKKTKNKMEIVLENWYSWFLRTVSVQHDSGSALKKLRQMN